MRGGFLELLCSMGGFRRCQHMPPSPASPSPPSSRLYIRGSLWKMPLPSGQSLSIPATCRFL